ncbi:MAG TPA: DUF192 domain-containing protein [Verrucomicrobiae bacterium]|nr:DUF192 domain-containing protein [Verrucomicrobiae bacterium]
MNRWIILAVLLAVTGLQGCGRSAGNSSGTSAAGTGSVAQAENDPDDITHEQPKLPTMKLYVGAEEMVAELALTPEQLRIGMMFRTNLADNAGMLFPLPYTQQASFWMKHCPLPLSAAYIDTEGVIQEIHEFEPFNTNSVVAASNNIRFVLETPQGWFQKHHIQPGMAVATERGPLMQTFFRAR